MTPTKKDTKEVDPALKDFDGFFRVGASTRSPGNIPTGHFELDFIIHYGISPKDLDLSTLEGYNPAEPLGLPRGKVVEVFGEEGAGKSSIGYRVVGYAQKMSLRAAWIDAENSWSDDLAEVNGVNKDEVIFSDLVNDDSPDRIYVAEDIFDAIVKLCKMNAHLKKGEKPLGVVVLDSVANLLPKARDEKAAAEVTVGVVARLMSENLKKIVNYAAKYGVLIIMINQIREKIGMMFGNPETTPGGRALKFLSSVRIRLGKRSNKDDDIFVADGNGQRLIGAYAKVWIYKNRFAKPYREAIRIPIYYEPYFVTVDDQIFDLARQLKIVKSYKGMYRWKEKEVEAQDKSNFISMLKYKGLVNNLLAKVEDVAKEEGVVLPPEITQAISERVEDLSKIREGKANEVEQDVEIEDESDAGVGKQTDRRKKREDSTASE